jgi:hypothetical protein
MIDMELFLALMDESSYSNRVSEAEQPAFLDNRIINETGIRAVRVENYILQQLTNGERQQLVLDDDDSSLTFPCSLAEFRAWVINNGYKDLVDWSNLNDENEKIKTIAKLNAERLRIRKNDVSTDDILSKDIRPADGNIDALTELYCWKSMLRRAIKDLDYKSSTNPQDTEIQKAKLKQKIEDIDKAIAAPLNLVKEVKPVSNGKTKSSKRSNALHDLIAIVDCHLRHRLQKKPTAHQVWKELRENYQQHDSDEIIQEISQNEIAWCSIYGNESSIKRKSFNAILSKLRRKISK